MVVSDLIEEVSRYLQDNEFEDDVSYVHWTRDDLLTYARNAVSIIAMVRKEEFLSTVDIPLVPGAYQSVPKPCKTVNTVQGQRGEDGVIMSRIREVKLTNLSTFARPVCTGKSNSKKGYVIKSYSYDENDPKTIIVDPPVPEDEDAILTITCYAPPEIKGMDDELDMDENFRPILFELMLYYAWGVDIEDQANRERSNKHWENAMTLLQIYDYKEQQALNKALMRDKQR